MSCKHLNLVDGYCEDCLTQVSEMPPLSPNTNIDEQVNILNILMYLRSGKTDIETAAKSIEALLSAAKETERNKILLLIEETLERGGSLESLKEELEKQ